MRGAEGPRGALTCLRQLQPEQHIQTHIHTHTNIREHKQTAVCAILSDGVFNATIWDVSVAPAWQREGLGRALMERLTRRLVEDGITNINLYAEAKVGAGMGGGDKDPAAGGNVARTRPRVRVCARAPTHTFHTNMHTHIHTQVVGLYKKLGFASDVEGIKGMAFQRRSPPGGAKQAGVAAASSRR